MTDFSGDAPPPLPLDALHEALGRADVDAAAALLDAHDRAVRLALAGLDPSLLDPRQRQAWMNLHRQQQEFLAELGERRDQAATQLRQLQRHQRGASAYQQAME